MGGHAVNLDFQMPGDVAPEKREKPAQPATQAIPGTRTKAPNLNFMMPGETPATRPAQLEAPTPEAAPAQPAKPNYWTQSVIKTTTGRGATDVVNEWVGALEKVVPDSAKKSLGGQYLMRTGEALAGLIPGGADFLTSPTGIPLVMAHLAPQTRPFAMIVDRMLGLYQGAEALGNWYDVGKETLKEGHPSPEKLASAIAGTLASAGIIKGVQEFDKGGPTFRDTMASLKNTTKREKFMAGVRYLAGETPEKEQLRQAKGIFRQRTAEAVVQYGRAVNQLADSLVHVEMLPDKERFNAIDKIETAGKTATGERAQSKQDTPELQTAADLVTGALDTEWAKIRKLGISGAAQHFYVNYLPRYFKEHEKAGSSIMGMFTSRPYKGSQEFRHERTILGPIRPLVDPELNPNPPLHLVTNNFVELGLMKLQEMGKFRAALEAVREMKQRGLIETVSEIGKKRPGWTVIEDRIIPKSEIDTGRYITAPDDVAKAINAYLSPGLGSLIRRKVPGELGKFAAGAVDAGKEFNNLTSRWLVNYSMFHPILSTWLSMTDAASLAPMYASRGKFKSAASSLAKSFGYAPIEDWRLGSKLLQHARDPFKNPEMASYLQKMEEGGGRAGVDLYYRSKIMDDFFRGAKVRALKSNSPLKGKAIKAMEGLHNYVMDQFVPRLKAGAAMRLLDYESDKLGPNASLEDRRAAFGKVIDSIDNRHGQLIYDNLFWPRVWKDAGFLGIQFMGWTLGSYREFGGAFKDIAQQVPKAILGKRPELSHRAAWVLFGLPFVVGLSNAVFQHLIGGGPVTDTKDLVMPKTGRLKPDKTPERIAPPWSAYIRTFEQATPVTFGRQGVEFQVRRPAQAVSSRLSNLVQLLWGTFATNEDYQRRELWNSEDPTIKNISREMGYMLSRMEPISIQSYFQTGETLSQPQSAARSFAGFREAPAEYSRSSAQNLIFNYTLKKMPQGPFSEEDFDKKAASKKLAEKLANGQANESDVSDAAQKMEISVRDAQLLLRRAKVPVWNARGSWGSRFVSLEAPQMMSVWRAATPEEKDELYTLVPFIRRKILTSERTKQPLLMKELGELLRQYAESRQVAPPEARQ